MATWRRGGRARREAAAVWAAAGTRVGLGIVVPLKATKAGSDIVLEGPDTDGTLNRRRFADIGADGFVWTGHESRGMGTTWHLVQWMRARRVARREGQRGSTNGRGVGEQ